MMRIRFLGPSGPGAIAAENLEDETGILVCGIYVDLNQIRAGEAATPKQSTHTSAYNRICAARQAAARDASGQSPGRDNEPPAACHSTAPEMPPDGWLCQLTLKEGLDADVRDGLSSSTPWRLTDKGILPIPLDDYLALLDWTGCQLVSGKSGSIPAHLASILERLQIRPQRWLESSQKFERTFGRAIGRAEKLAGRVAGSGRHWDSRRTSLRRLLLKNPENLDEGRSEHPRLAEALRLNEPLEIAYYMKEDLRQLWTRTTSGQRGGCYKTGLGVPTLRQHCFASKSRLSDILEAV